MVKNFYAKRDKMFKWQVADYDNQTQLAMFNNYSIFRVFKEEFLIKENSQGVKADALKKYFDADLNEYKKAEIIETKKKYDQSTKTFYTCFDNEVWINDKMLDYLDSKQSYSFYYKSKREPIFVTLRDYKVAMILPVNTQD